MTFFPNLFPGLGCKKPDKNSSLQDSDCVWCVRTLSQGQNGNEIEDKDGHGRPVQLVGNDAQRNKDKENVNL